MRGCQQLVNPSRLPSPPLSPNPPPMALELYINNPCDWSLLIRTPVRLECCHGCLWVPAFPVVCAVSSQLQKFIHKKNPDRCGTAGTLQRGRTQRVRRCHVGLGAPPSKLPLSTREAGAYCNAHTLSSASHCPHLQTVSVNSAEGRVIDLLRVMIIPLPSNRGQTLGECLPILIC